MKAAAKLAWAKFYFSDWRSDPCLRVCSLAARGLWMEMLGIMHEADPYGHLLINGKAPSDAQLAAVAGAPLDLVVALLVELEGAGVFSRNRAGVIYSRRMTRAVKKATVARTNGRLGGNPALVPGGKSGPGKNETGRYRGDNREIIPENSSENSDFDDGISAGNDGDIQPSDKQTSTDSLKGRHNTQRLEARDYKEEERISAASQPRPTDVPDDLGLTTDQSAPVIPLKTPKRPDRSPEMFVIWRGLFELVWPKDTALPPARVKKLNTRLIDTFGGDIEQWRQFCQTVAATPFLVGEGPKGWRASLNWLLEPAHIAKVVAGNYDNLAPPNRGYGSNVQRTDRRQSPHDAMVAGYARASGYDTDGTGDR